MGKTGVVYKMGTVAVGIMLACSGCGGRSIELFPTATPQAEVLPGQLVAPQDQELPLDGYMAQQNDRRSTADVAARVTPSVVGLAVESVSKSGDGVATVQGVGTGVFVDKDGYILTNHHVAGNATQITVVFSDGRTIPGVTLWSDPALDLAIVKCEGGPYPAATLGSVTSLRVGDPVIAVGTPLDLAFQHTVTAGIVSAKERTVQLTTEQGVSFMEQLIQTDASINPGNSGGPLCDGNGYVVGINTVKLIQAEGIGFAIPIDVARPIIRHVVETGSYETPYLGLFAIDRAIARYYGKEVQQGIAVLNVDIEGPAYGCGVRKDDCITRVNGQPVNNMLQLRCIINELGVGSQVRLEWLVGGREKAGECTLITKPVLQ